VEDTPSNTQVWQVPGTNTSPELTANKEGRKAVILFWWSRPVRHENNLEIIKGTLSPNFRITLKS